MFKVPTTVLAHGSGVSKRASRDLFERDFSSNFDEGSGERARHGGVRTGRKWATLVVSRASSTAPVSPSPTIAEDCKECSVLLRTTKGCGLGVSRYPDFVYNAEGGGGRGKAVKMEDGRWSVKFDAAEVNIPDVGFRTTTLLGIPLPPPIKIEIVPEFLEGIVDRDTGKVELNFLAKFFFSTGPLYRPSPLIVETLLTTEKAQGELRGGTGTRLDADGNCRMVGVARLAPIDDLFMDTFLMMPTDCLADMAANITFTS